MMTNEWCYFVEHLIKTLEYGIRQIELEELEQYPLFHPSLLDDEHLLIDLEIKKKRMRCECFQKFMQQLFGSVENYTFTDFGIGDDSEEMICFDKDQFFDDHADFCANGDFFLAFFDTKVSLLNAIHRSTFFSF